MAKTDQFDRMNTDQLNAEAAQRGIDATEFAALANNSERAQRLRDHDTQSQAQTDADAQTALDNARTLNEQGQATETRTAEEAEAQARAEQPAREAQEARNQAAARGDSPGPFDVAPYPSEQSRQAAVDAASGNLSTTQSIDPGQAEPVGGQDTGPTPAEQEQARQEGQQGQ